MALRDQPYLPLYVQDFLTDEKLNECSAESTGVYIRLMCVMHKSEEYGKILLKQKDKQTSKQISNFAMKLARQMPYEAEVIERSLSELVEEEVIAIEGDILFQKRMVKDDKVSSARALAGKKGQESKGKKSDTANTFAEAKPPANTEYENEYAIVNDNERDNEHESKLSKNQENSTPREARRKRGEYGWILLSDKEYNKLLNDLGEDELNRCVGYIDESAQTTGNKNKWKDWNLVIRKCSRDRWGLNNIRAKPNGASALSFLDENI